MAAWRSAWESHAAARIPLEAIFPDSPQAVYEAFLYQPSVLKIVIGIHDPGVTV